MGLLAAILGYIGYDRMVKTQIVQYPTSDTWQLLQAASRDGALGVATLGGAFGLDAEALNARIAAALRANFSDPWLQFETDAAKPHNGFRLVFLPDAADGRMPDFGQACAGTRHRQTPDSENFNLFAVLCGPNGVAAAAQGWLKRPADPQDPALDRLFVQIGNTAMRGKT